MADPRYRAVIQRRATDEESVQIEVRSDDLKTIADDIDAFLAQLRRARVAHNEEVIAVFEKKSRELDAEIDHQGERVRALNAELAEKGSRAERRRRQVNGQDPAGAY